MRFSLLRTAGIRASQHISHLHLQINLGQRSLLSVGTHNASSKRWRSIATNGADVGAYCIGKNVELLGGAMPSPSCGEDAYFTAYHDNVVGLGVADGVGGWADQGVDPSLFSNELMLLCKNAFMKGNRDAQGILSEAYEQLVSEGHVTAGSSTACITLIDITRSTFTSASLGDSGWMLIRKNDLGKFEGIEESQKQQHFFNAPYQLGVDHSNRDHYSDQPSQAAVQTLPLQPNDVLLLATDGLFDNMFTHEVLEEVDRVLAPSSTPSNTYLPALTYDQKRSKQVQELAESLCIESRRMSLNPARKYTPFSSAYFESIGYARDGGIGGKLDDVTVLVSSFGG